MTVRFFAPLPPARTGVADYAASLLEALRKQGPVESGGAGPGPALYHLGNNHLHGEIYERSLAEPGVVVLHDAVLHHFLLGRLPENSYLEEFVYNYGEWNRDLARVLWRDRARSAADPRYFDYPMVRRAVERAKAVVVHNPAAARIARTHRASRVLELPHLFSMPPLPERANVAPEGVFLFGVFGHLRESKRLASVLAAFRRVKRECPRVALLVAGDFVSPDLARVMEPLLQTEGIYRTGYTPERDFWRYALAVDACVNLRYPAAGETSGISIRFMGIGKTVIVSTGEENSRFPDGTCLRVDPGPAEVDMLTAYMGLLARTPEVAVTIGSKAAAHIAAHHGPDQVGARFREVLENS
jgi:glycosyltransferase involved in cell wall biosynthesis